MIGCGIIWLLLWLWLYHSVRVIFFCCRLVIWWLISSCFLVLWFFCLPVPGWICFWLADRVLLCLVFYILYRVCHVYFFLLVIFVFVFRSLVVLLWIFLFLLFSVCRNVLRLNLGFLLACFHSLDGCVRVSVGCITFCFCVGLRVISRFFAFRATGGAFRLPAITRDDGWRPVGGWWNSFW